MKLIVNMKKGLRRLTCFIGVLCMLLTMFTFLAAPAMADATRVVTLGQDLSDEQEAFIVNYFGVDLSTARVIYVNNWQEREILGSWIPLEQIGNITISSAYVQPTNSGGIQVRTANLTYVTGNMIASVLSTAGITNCNVVAAAPFPVSGTGALTGVMIAYQAATGEELDNTKRDLAVQEFTVTQQASGSIGEDQALQLVNAVKMEVLQSGVSAEDTQKISDIVDQVVSDMDQSLAVSGDGNQIDSLNMDQGVNVDNSTNTTTNTYYDYSVSTISNGLSSDDRQMLIDLAAKIAEQDYDKDAVMETLERVNENLADKTNIEINVSNGNNIDNSNSVTNDTANTNNSSSDTEVSADDEDSIFNTLNVEELSADVQSATDTAGMAQIEEQMQEEAIEAKQAVAPDAGFSIMNEETFVLNSDTAGTEQTEQLPEQPQMPEYTETVVPEQPEQTEQLPEQPQMPEYTETVVPEQPEQTEQLPEQPQMPDYTETVVPEQPAASADQWKVAKVPEGQTMRADVQEVWDTLESTVYEGVKLTPAVYLGSQLVSGLNYAILCTGVPADAEGEDVEETLYMVIMYEPLDGAVSITHMTKLDLDALANKQTEAETGEPVTGGWEFSKAAQDVPTSMEQVTASVFGALPAAYPEKNLTPVMLLATKQTDVTEYAVLCYEIPEGAESGFYEVAFATGDQFGYITDSNLVPLNLADYNS